MGIMKPGFGGDIDKAPPSLAVRLVVVKDHLAQVSDEQVIEAVVIEISDGAAHAEAGSGESYLLGDIAERAVAVVTIELAGRQPGGARWGLDGTVLDQEEIGPAVVVVVDPGEPAAHGLVNVVHRG